MKERYNAKARASSKNKGKKHLKVSASASTSTSPSASIPPSIKAKNLNGSVAPSNRANGNKRSKDAELEHDNENGQGEIDSQTGQDETMMDVDHGDDHYSATDTANQLIILPGEKGKPSRKEQILSQLPEQPEGKLSSKKRKRLEKFIDKQLKKEERVKLLDKLSKTSFQSDLLVSSKNMGRAKLTAKERLHKAFLEHKHGLDISDPNVKLFVEHEQKDWEEDEQMLDAESAGDSDEETTQEENKKKKKKKKEPEVVVATGFGASLKKKGEQPSAAVPAPAPAFGGALKAKTGASAFGGALKSNKDPPAAATPGPSAFGSGLKKKVSEEANSSASGSSKKNKKKTELTKSELEEAVAALGAKKGKEGVSSKVVSVLDMLLDDESEDDDSDEEDEDQDDSQGVSDSEFDESEDDDDEEDEPEKELPTDKLGNTIGGTEEEEGSSDSDSESEEDRPAPKRQKSLWKSDVVAGEKLPEHPKPPISSKPMQPTTSTQPLKPSKPAFYVPVHRPPEIAIARMNLPVVGEEQPIMEAIYANDCILLCGETGSGKTTQVPQFLYEAGFGSPQNPTFPGLIGVTQPRRVAAVSMAQRVGEELGLKTGEVAYQIRYDSSTVVPGKTRIKFMTDGILLREISGSSSKLKEDEAAVSKGGADLLLSKYSCIIIDEAHERTVGTDVLIGWLTRIATLRNSGKVKGVGPLKLVIMSATLRVADFTSNTTLFPSGPPPVIKVDGRQYKVTIHYNRVTPEVDYVTEAFKKVSKIQTRLPPGGVLVFLTGQSEIVALVRKLKAAFGPKKKKGRGVGDSEDSEEKMGVDEESGVFGEEEDGEVDSGAVRVFEKEGEDDFDRMLEEEDDDEEEEVEVLDGADGEDPLDEEGFIVPSSAADRPPLYVLPLYSLLPTSAQMKVFENPPEGTRLCVVATNVAETSLTIPGIRYVVDCGKVKERCYEPSTGTQKFRIGWTSRASADQRAGRAGRMGPGHCYRLFSSAVFANHFEGFSKPEIQRIPIEGVILQMKSMGIANVINFPFPTPPGKDNLKSAEKLLVNLGAVESGVSEMGTKEGMGKITELGNILSKFPVSPRFGKMLVIAARQSMKILQYMVALVAGLSIGDPFIRDEDIIGMSRQVEDDEDDDSAEKARRSKKRAEWHKVMHLFGGDPPTSDALRTLRVVGAFLVASSTSSDKGLSFAESHFLRFKALEEITKLRSQLIHLAITYIPNVIPHSKHLQLNAMMEPPSPEECAMLRQIILAGYPDQIARFDPIATRTQVIHGIKNPVPLYTTMWGNQKQVFAIHASSCLVRERPAPDWIVYEEVVGAEERLTADNSAVMNLRNKDTDPNKPQRLLLKTVTMINESWIAPVAPKTLLTQGRVLEQPEPHYDGHQDKVVGFAGFTYGPLMWELPVREVDLSQKESVQWFARALLEGKVQPARAWGKKKKAKTTSRDIPTIKDLFTVMSPFLNAKPSIVTKSWAKVQPKVSGFLGALLAADVITRQALLRRWYTEPMFLLKEYLAWVPSTLHPVVQSIWPPVEFIQEYETLPTADKTKKLAPNEPLPKYKDKAGAAKKLETIILSMKNELTGQKVAPDGGESDADSDA
ncbi:ATP-dependent RNA helicase dhx37 [Chytridiales sp. JEL 0842]|nr:ATP-dependent RNA helicase dhx37 [Chytridiales sp. JEL 0842]